MVSGKKMLFVDNIENEKNLCKLFDAMYDELPALKKKDKKK